MSQLTLYNAARRLTAPRRPAPDQTWTGFDQMRLIPTMRCASRAARPLSSQIAPRAARAERGCVRRTSRSAAELDDMLKPPRRASASVAAATGASPTVALRTLHEPPVRSRRSNEADFPE